MSCIFILSLRAYLSYECVECSVVFLRDFPLESAVPALPEKTASSSSGRSTPMTPEQLRQQSWNQDSFIPQFLYDAMSENKRFDSMRVSSSS